MLELFLHASLSYVSFGAEFPQVILDIERGELGISAGLQDRVIQTFGGLVHMDFSADRGSNGSGSSRYTPLDPLLLPHMYLAYDVCSGSNTDYAVYKLSHNWNVVV